MYGFLCLSLSNQTENHDPQSTYALHLSDYFPVHWTWAIFCRMQSITFLLPNFLNAHTVSRWYQETARVSFFPLIICGCVLGQLGLPLQFYSCKGYITTWLNSQYTSDLGGFIFIICYWFFFLFSFLVIYWISHAPHFLANFAVIPTNFHSNY